MGGGGGGGIMSYNNPRLYESNVLHGIYMYMYKEKKKFCLVCNMYMYIQVQLYETLHIFLYLRCWGEGISVEGVLGEVE